MPKDKKPSKAELEQQLAEQNREMLTECRAEIDAILQKHGCVMIPVVMVRGTELAAYVEIMLARS